MNIEPVHNEGSRPSLKKELVRHATISCISKKIKIVAVLGFMGIRERDFFAPFSSLPQQDVSMI